MAVFSWGLGKCGQLGSGKFEDSPLPVRMKLPKSAGRPRELSVGGLYTFVLTSHADIYVSGCGKFGRMGTNSESDVISPKKVTVGKDTKIAKLSSGSWHSGCVTYLGRLYMSGYNSKHRVLGREDDNKFCCSPSIVNSLLTIKIKSVSCGHSFTLVNSEDGHMYSWGCGKYGVLGHGDEQSITTPHKISSLSTIPIETICAGFTHCAAVSRDGRLFTWGKGQDGALGLGISNCKNKSEPTWVYTERFMSVLIEYVACSLGEHKSHTLALSREGVLYSFGSNIRGCLGLGDQEPRWSPIRIPNAFFDGQSVVSIATGGSHSVAVTSDGHVYSWGCGKDGKLGHKEYMDKPKTFYSVIPKKVEALKDTIPWKKGLRAVKAAASNSHTCVILDFL